MFLAQEILVGYSSYPTREIERNAKAYRQLGLGYANLGALLMARGLPYDSNEGRAYAAAITAIMTGRAYRKSAEMAGRIGPFLDYDKNADAMLRVIRKHRAAVANIDAGVVPDEIRAARVRPDRCLRQRAQYGGRSARLQGRAHPRVRRSRRRQGDPPHGSRQDDGGGAAIHLGCHLEDRQSAQRRHR